MRRIVEVRRLRVALGDNVSAIAAGAWMSRTDGMEPPLKRAAAAGIDAAASPPDPQAGVA